MKKQLLLVMLFLAVGAITSQAQTRALQKEIVNKLIAEGEISQQKVKERGGFDKIVGITNVDLNKDSKPEFIVVCGCEVSQMIYLMRKTANEIKIIFKGYQRQYITPLKTYTKGWRNLRLTSYRSVDGATYSETLRWNGFEYKES